MADNNIGGISWTVDADTSPAVNSTKQLDAQVDKAEKTLDKFDKSAKKATESTKKIEKETKRATKTEKQFEFAMSKTAVAVRAGIAGMNGISVSTTKAAAKVGKLNDEVEDLGGELDAVAPKIDRVKSGAEDASVKLAKLERVTAKYTQILQKNGSSISKNGVVLNRYGKVSDIATARLKKLNTQHEMLSASSRKTNVGLANTSRGLGQASVQAQQFIGQVQGGQSILLAFSQQIADVGIVLGAPLLGAVAGISASLIGMLLPSVMSSKTGLEMLEKATENVKAALTLSVDGVIEYTDQMKKLKLVSESLARIKVATLIAEQQTALDEAGKSFKQALSDAQGWATGYGAVYKIFKNETVEARESLKELKKTAKEFSADNAAESIERLESALSKAGKAGLNNTKVGRELASQMVALISGYKTGEKTIADLDSRLKDLNFDSGETKKKNDAVKDSVKAMVTALQEQAAALNETNRQTALRIALENKATDAQITSINAAFDDIEAKQQLIDKQKDIDAQMNASFNAEVGRERKRKQSEAAAERKRKQVEAAAAKKKATEAETEKRTAITTTESIISRGETPEDRRAAEMESLQSWHEQMLISDSEFQSARTQLEQEGAAARTQIAQMALGSFSNSFGQLAGILKQSEGEQSSAYKAMFALSKGFAVAQAGVNMALAISEATKLPWPANLPAIAQATASGAALVGQISGATYSGRENGGSVIGGQTYEVGEKNKPELLMIPGNNGKVFSNSEAKNMMGGGGGSNNAPIINNYMGGTATVEHRRDELTQRDVFDIVQSEMTNPNSRGRRGMQRNSNLSGTLNGGRRR